MKDTTIRKWGNSFGVTLEKEVLELKGWKVGQKLNIKISKDGLNLKERGKDHEV